MTELSHARLIELLDAYGADSRRWPATERGPVLALVRADEGAQAAFDRALALDAMLDDAPVAPPSPALRARLIAASPRAPIRRRARGWWAALLLVGAGGAGVVAGSAAAAMLIAPLSSIAEEEQTAFGDLGIGESVR